MSAEAVLRFYIYIYIVIIKICKKLLENAYMLNSYFSCSNITSLVLLMIN